MDSSERTGFFILILNYFALAEFQKFFRIICDYDDLPKQSLMVPIILEMIFSPSMIIFAFVTPPNLLLAPPARITPEIRVPICGFQQPPEAFFFLATAFMTGLAAGLTCICSFCTADPPPRACPAPFRKSYFANSSSELVESRFLRIQY